MRLRYVDTVTDQHAYYLDGKRCKSVTTIAKMPDDSYNLERWRQRMVAQGVANDPELAEKIRNAETKDELDALVAQAKNHAGAGVAAAAGTELHRITELWDRGESGLLSTTDRFFTDVWTEQLAALGVEVVRSHIENIVVYPDELVCGRYDRIVRRSDGTLAVVDLKTGKGASNYPHATAIQLALYANAPLVGAVNDEGGETEELVPMPENVDKKTGYMIQLVDGEAPAVWAVNLEMGWQAVQKVIWPTLRWRAMRKSKLVKKL